MTPYPYAIIHLQRPVLRTVTGWCACPLRARKRVAFLFEEPDVRVRSTAYGFERFGIFKRVICRNYMTPAYTTRNHIG